MSVSHASLQRQIRTFNSDASIVFIGPRGNGKSSLAVIAATALQREVVDAEDFFYQQTGMTQAVFRKAHGVEEHRLRQADILREMLLRHEKDCVIACGPHVVVGKGRKVLQDYSKCHAVICVSREADAIERYLDFRDQGGLTDVIQEMHSRYHEVSNFEYYNLAERWRSAATSSSEDNLQDILPNREHRRRSLQTLQNTKKDLIRFLDIAFGLTPCAGLFHTLSPADPEKRPNTVALSFPMDLVESPNVDLDRLEGANDAVELVMEVTLPALSASTAATMCDNVGRSVAVIRRHFALPIICHFRLDSIDGSQLTADNLRAYFDLLHLALRFAPEYLTVDLRSPDDVIRTLVHSRGRTKIMGNLQNLNAQQGLWTDQKADQNYQRAKALGCNIVRLYQSALSTTDNFSCLAFMSRINSLSNEVPVIAYNAGALGNLSSAFNSSLTPVTHPLLQAGSPPAEENATSLTEPSITSREIQDILYATQTLNALKFYVFGSDVNNSLSPAVHNTGFDACGMPHTYTIRQCDSLKDVRALIQDRGFGGASISMPFKPEIVLLIESLSSAAKEIGAVNTLIPVRYLDGQQLPADPCTKHQRNRAGPITALHGANTDWMGIYACISRYMSPANAPSPRTTGVVIGAGGIARAAIYALAQLGVSNIFVLNRTLANAEILAKHYNSEVKASHDTCNSASTSSTPKAVKPVVHILKSQDDIWSEEFSYPSIVVYTIPKRQAETSGHRDLGVPAHWLQNPTGGLLVDVSYHEFDPAKLHQVRESERRGWVTIDPIEVFFEQACAQFELFTGTLAPRSAMWESCLRQYNQHVEKHLGRQ